MIDVFGPEMKIKIENNETYKSRSGGLITIFYFLFLFNALIFNGSDIIIRKKPNILFNHEKEDDTSFNLSSENFAFSLINQTHLATIEDFEKKFTFHLEVFNDYSNGIDFNRTNYKILQCEKNVLEKMRNNLRGEKKYWCLEKNKHILMNGTYLIVNYTSIRLNISYCDNERDNKTNCISKKETKKNLPYLFMNIIFDDPLIDHYSNEQFKENYYVENVLSNNNTFARTTFYFKKIVYDTDFGWFLTRNETKTKNAFDYSVNSPISDPDTNTIFSILIVNSNSIEMYQRSYIKLQKIFSTIGGYITISNILFGIICKYLTYPSTLEIFYKKYHSKKKPPNTFKINEIHIDSELFKQSNVSTKSIKINEIQNEEMNSSVNTISKGSKENNLKLALIEMTKIDELEKNRESIVALKIRFKLEKFSIYDKFFRIFFCLWKEEKKSQFNKLNQLFLKKFSVEHFIKLSRKISLIEALLFQRYQRDLLKYVGVPEFEKIYTPYEKSIENLILNLSNPINRNLLRYLNNEFHLID